MEIPIVQVDKCEKCLMYYPIKSVHRCVPLTVQEPSNNIITNLNPKTVSNGRYKNILPAEKKELLLKIHYDDDDDVDQTKVKDSVNDFHLTSCIINAIKVRRPLFDHTIPTSERSQSIKNKLWIEVYKELKGQVSVSKLKKTWSYLREKYVHERQILKKGGTKSKWLRYVELSFLEKIETKCRNKKTAKNLDLNLDKYSEDSTQNLTTAKNKMRKEKNDNNLQRNLLNEHTIAARQTELIEEPNDSDVAFGKYLVALMKDLPIKKRKILQCQFIESVIIAQDL